MRSWGRLLGWDRTAREPVGPVHEAGYRDLSPRSRSWPTRIGPENSGLGVVARKIAVRARPNQSRTRGTDGRPLALGGGRGRHLGPARPIWWTASNPSRGRTCTSVASRKWCPDEGTSWVSGGVSDDGALITGGGGDEVAQVPRRVTPRGVTTVPRCMYPSRRLTLRRPPGRRGCRCSPGTPGVRRRRDARRGRRGSRSRSPIST